VTPLPLPLPMAMIHVYWFVVPLVAAISLVYAATRHESWPRIWMHALRLGCWVMGLFALTTAALLLVNYLYSS